MSARHSEDLSTSPLNQRKNVPTPGAGGTEKKRKTYKPYLGFHSKQIPSPTYKTLPGTRATVQTLHHQGAEELTVGFLPVRGLLGPAEIPRAGV